MRDEQSTGGLGRARSRGAVAAANAGAFGLRRPRATAIPHPHLFQETLKNLGFQLAEQVRYNERTAGERVNGRLKDEFGGRHVRVRGAAKVMCHCMFGVLALTVDQLVRLVT